MKRLASIGWLAGEAAAFRSRMASIGQWVYLSGGEPAYQAGDDPIAIYGLEDGFLDVSVPVDEVEEVLIHRAPPGFWIGDGAILNGTRHVISIRAAVRCRLFAIPGGALRHDLERYPEGWLALQRLAALNGTLAVTVLAEGLVLPPRSRFARLLLRCAAPDGSVRATQEDLGRMLGLSRMAFRRAFREFIEAGVIRTGYGLVQILDHDRLMAIGRGKS